MMAKQISKDMLINDIIAVDEGNAAILMASGMHCIGCLAAAGETLEEAAAVHGLNADELTKDINDYLAKKEA
jgi:hybrid cluster-associated redox disulfide protein